MAQLAKRRSPLRTASRRPIVRATLLLAVLGGLFVAWWLFPLGVLFALTEVVVIARDPALRVRESMATRRDPLTPRFQTLFDRIQTVQVNTLSLLAVNNGDYKALELAQPELDSLVDQAYYACDRMAALESLRSRTLADLERSLASSQRRVNTTRDPVTRSAYERAAQDTQARLELVGQLKLQLDRVEAEIANLASTLEGYYAELVRQRSRGPQAVTGYAAELAAELRQRGARFTQFEQEVAELAQFEEV